MVVLSFPHSPEWSRDPCQPQGYWNHCLSHLLGHGREVGRASALTGNPVAPGPGGEMGAFRPGGSKYSPALSKVCS